MKNKKILVAGVMLSLLGIGNIGECETISRIPYKNHIVCSGDFVYVGDNTYSTPGDSARGIIIGALTWDDKPPISLKIRGKIRYQPPNAASKSNWGVILAYAESGGPLNVHVEKTGYVETTGTSAKGIYLTGPNVHILNQGKIVIKKSNILPEISTWCHGILLEQGADCINEGEIEVTGSHSSSCIIANTDKKGRPSVRIVNKGTLKALHETTGIMVLGKKLADNHDIFNEGKIIGKDKGRGILLNSDPQNLSRFNFTNSGSISVENCCCINSTDKRTSGARNTVTLQAKSNLLVTGDNSIAVILDGSVGNSVGDNTVKNTGKNSTGFSVKNSTLEIKNGTLSVANEGVGGKGFLITERGNLNIIKNGIKIDSPLKDSKNLTEMSYGVRVEKASSGKINKGTFLTINTHKIGQGAVQVADKSAFSNEGDLTIVSHHAKANGMGIDNANVNLVGNTNISSQQDGINGKKNSNLFMNGTSKTTVKAKGIGLKLEENSVANNAGTSVLNIEMDNAANQGTGISLKNKSTFNSKGKVSITGNHETKEGYALEGHSVLNLEGEITLTNVKEGFALKGNSVLNLKKGSKNTLKENLVGIKASNNSALNSEAGSTLNITSTKANAKGIELLKGDKDSTLQGKTIINIDSSKDSAIENTSGKSLILKNGSVTELNAKNGAKVLSLKGEGSALIMEKGSVLTGSTTKGNFVTLENKAKGQLAGKVSMTGNHENKNGYSVAGHSVLTLEGETTFSNFKEGFGVEDNSILNLNKGSQSTLTENQVGIKVSNNSALNSEADSTLTITSTKADAKGIELLKGDKDSTLQGKTIINLDSSKNQKLSKGSAIENTSGKSLTLKTGSVTELNVKNGAEMFYLKGEGSDLIMEKGSVLTGSTTKGNIVTLDNNAKGQLAGEIIIKRSGDNSNLFKGNEGTAFNIANDNLTITHKGNGNKVFQINKSKINFMSPANVTITMEGNNNKVICASNQSNVTSDPTSNLNITLKGEGNHVIFAEQQGTTTGTNEVTLNNSKINIEGKNSTVAYATGQQSIITLNAVDVKCAKDNEFCRLENGGTINLVNMEYEDVPIGTLSSGTINLNNTTWKGEVFHGKKGTSAMGDVGALNIHLNNSAFFAGTTKMYSTNPLAKINVSIEPSAAWIIPTNNKLQGTLRNEGNLIFSNHDFKEHKTLEVNDYAGTNGNIVFTTDFASEVGDKLVIKNATQKSTGNISVVDKSLLTDEKVMGNKTLLLVEDPSGLTEWQGKSLDTGGIWEITPFVVRGEYAGLNNTNWYLSSIKINPAPVIDDLSYSFEANYGLLRNLLTDDSLRQRSGSLFSGTAEEGVWTRIKSGEGVGVSSNTKYQTHQIGYDKKIDQDSFCGIAISHSKGKNSFARAKGTNALTAASLYATNYYKSGLYNDLVFHIGQLRSNTDVFRTTKDHFQQRAWCYGLSYELGKHFNNKNGWFIEPQGKISYAFVRKEEFKTDKNMKVKAPTVPSFLGRVGFNFGRKIKGGEYYLKAHLLREFKGEGDMQVSTTNDYGNFETGTFSRNYKDSWYEVGLGTNVQLTKDTYFYGDLLKTFGADVRKKWQGNLGFKFAF